MPNHQERTGRCRPSARRCNGGCASPMKIIKDFLKDDRAKALPPATCWGDPLRKERGSSRAKAPPHVQDVRSPLRQKGGNSLLRGNARSAEREVSRAKALPPAMFWRESLTRGCLLVNPIHGRARALPPAARWRDQGHLLHLKGQSRNGLTTFTAWDIHPPT